MTFKQWLREINNNPTRANELATLADQAERQREIAEDVSIDIHFGEREIIKANEYAGKEIDMMEENMDYLDYKVKVLAQLGLTNKKLVELYLHCASRNATTENSRITRIDNAARKILTDYYDGDSTYVR